MPKTTARENQTQKDAAIEEALQIRIQMNKHDVRFTRIRRLLAWTAIIICGSVLAYAVLMIVLTDAMTSNSQRMYQTGYDAMLTARSLQTGILRIRSQVETYLENPASEESRETISEIHRWYRKNSDDVDAFSVLLTPEEREELKKTLRTIYDEQNAAFAEGQVGDSEAGFAIYTERLRPLYASVDETLEQIVENGLEGLKGAEESNEELNRQANVLSVVLACAVTALCAYLTILCANRIEKSSEELYRKELLFNLIAGNTDDVFEIYDFDEDRMSYVSDNLLRVFGVTAEDYVADNDLIRGYIDPADMKKVAGIYYNKDMKKPTSFEFRYTNPRSGKHQLFSSSLYPIAGDDDDEVKYHVLLTRDVTEERRTHEAMRLALEQAEAADKSRRQFLQRMSHEVRTPINAIIGMQALAENSLGDEEKVRSSLQKIGSSARQLLVLVNDILDMSKIESGRLELHYAPFDLGSMIDDLRLIVVSKLQKKKQTLDIDTSTCVCQHLIGDEIRLRQVLLNFLSNASKYSAEGSVIRLIVRQSPPQYGFTHMVFSVEDHGRGIPADEVYRIFLPFERGTEVVDRTSGTGLGLPISKHVIEEMGGSIWAESVEGEGSTFSFEVSLGVTQQEQEDEQTEEAPVVHLVAEEHPRVLVVEDNDINMEITRELLTQQGYAVEEAVNGQEAVDLFEKAPSGWYAAVLMDIQMPVMDGHTATRLIRENAVHDGQTIPILAVTADPFVTSDKNAQTGFTGCIGKPVDADLMISMLQDAIAAYLKNFGGSSGLS